MGATLRHVLKIEVLRYSKSVKSNTFSFFLKTKCYFELFDASNIRVIVDSYDNKYYQFYNSDGLLLEIVINLSLAMVGSLYI